MIKHHLIYPLYLIQDSASAKDLQDVTLALIYQNVDWLHVSATLLSMAQRVLTPSLEHSLSSIQRHSGARCPPTSIRRIRIRLSKYVNTLNFSPIFVHKHSHFVMIVFRIFYF